MRSRTTRRFRELLSALPANVQVQARSAYRQFLVDPHHPGLRFKRVHATQPIYSARVGKGYRAVGIMLEGAMVWYWIGSHAEYDHLLQRR